MTQIVTKNRNIAEKKVTEITVLSSDETLKSIGEGKTEITPFCVDQVDHTSIDLTLGN